MNHRTTVACAACETEVDLKGDCPRCGDKFETGYLTTCADCGDKYFRYPDHVRGFAYVSGIIYPMTKPWCQCANLSVDEVSSRRHSVLYRC